MVVRSCYPSTGRKRQEGHEFKANVDSIERLSPKRISLFEMERTPFGGIMMGLN